MGGVPLSVLEQTHQGHFDAAKKMEKDPDGGSWPAYPSGKSWDEPSGKTGSGKKFYHNIIPGSAVATEPFYVAIITPVIHYCMGGLEITEDAEVLGKSGVIGGLYAAGEIAGGVHGNNRLGGNSLLDCVVFGRVAGKAACKYTFGADNRFKLCPEPQSQGTHCLNECTLVLHQLSAACFPADSLSLQAYFFLQAFGAEVLVASASACFSRSPENIFVCKPTANGA